MNRKQVTKRAASSTSLAARISAMEDCEAIRSLVNNMNWMADEGRIDDLLECFTGDLMYDVGAFGTYTGKPALRSFYEEVLRSFPMRIHSVTNQVIELKGSKAESRCYWKAELDMQFRAVISSGHYLDELVKRRGQWKVAKRTAVVRYMCPLDEGWCKTRMMNPGQ